MNRIGKLSTGVLLGLTALVVAGPAVLADGSGQGSHHFRARLRGFEETPAIVTAASGTIDLAIAPDDSSIDYTLTFADLEAPSLFAHIHVGERAVAGGVGAFLCGGGSKPPCPTTGGTVTGTILASDVVGPAAQGVAAGQLSRFLEAIRAGAAYANVHSTLHPGGEIRGQLHGADGDEAR
jgi:CHRD domain